MFVNLIAAKDFVLLVGGIAQINVFVIKNSNTSAKVVGKFNNVNYYLVFKNVPIIYDFYIMMSPTLTSDIRLRGTIFLVVLHLLLLVTLIAFQLADSIL